MNDYHYRISSDVCCYCIVNGFYSLRLRTAECGNAGSVCCRPVSDAVHLQHSKKRPIKYGIVIRDPDGMKVDSPSVFRHEGLWYMIYIRFNDTGYETLLAESDDLLNWQTLGTVLRQGSGDWDDKQVAGYIALQDCEWGGSYGLEPYEGLY